MNSTPVCNSASEVRSLSGEYIWKYTHNAYDFSVLGSTPSRFRSSGITPRFQDCGRVSVPNFHGFSALMVFSSVAARFSLRRSEELAVPSWHGG
jgi:hypothetical protein